MIINKYSLKLLFNNEFNLGGGNQKEKIMKKNFLNFT